MIEAHNRQYEQETEINQIDNINGIVQFFIRTPLKSLWISILITGYLTFSLDLTWNINFKLNYCK